MVLRIGFSLLVVFAIMWGLAKVARKPLAGRAAGALAVIGRQQLTRGASLAVVRVADRTLIVGVTESQVTLLGETDAASFVRADEPVREPVALPAREEPANGGTALHGSVLSPRTWTQTVEFLRDRTVRH
jgi:flagellar protein FliO/FliZ